MLFLGSNVISLVWQQIKLIKMSILFCTLLLISFIGASYGIKETYSKQRSGIFGDYLVNDFGMAVGGVIQVDYHVVPKYQTEQFDSYLLLLVISSDQKDSWYDGLGDSDGDVTKNINMLCNQPAVYRQELFGSGTINFDISYSVGVDRFSVGVLQCRAGNSENPISMDITVEMKNARPNSDEYSHFPIQQVMQVRVLEGELILYALMIVGMIGQIYVAG